MKVYKSKQKHKFENDEGTRVVTLNSGMGLNDVAAIMIIVALYPETLQGLYAEMMKLVSGGASAIPNNFTHREPELDV